MNLANACGAALLDNVGSKINLVMRRANAGAELHNQIGRVRSESFSHLLNRFGNDRQLSALFSRVHQTDGERFRIDNVNRAAIGHVNAERDPTLVGN